VCLGLRLSELMKLFIKITVWEYLINVAINVAFHLLKKTTMRTEHIKNDKTFILVKNMS
jgi:hypothetical protein